MRKTVGILGIPIDDLDMEEVLERIDAFVRSGRFHQVATANTDFLINALTDHELRTILREADLVVPDGMPLVIASRWLHAGLRERVTGADLVPRLAAQAAQRGYRLFMLGGMPEVATKAKERLETENPGLQIVGCVSPPFAPIEEMDNEALLAQIEEAHPHVLLVAFGNPKQEKWIYRHRHRLRVPVCMGVGGTFDFIAGATVRAPVWMQRAGLEWFHRLVHNPRRLWKRYLTDILQFSRYIAYQVWMLRQGASSMPPRLVVARVGECTVVSAHGLLDKRMLEEFQCVADKALNEGTHLILDFLGVTAIDSAILGTLLNLSKRATYVHREVRLVGLNEDVRRALRACHMEDLYTVYPTLADALIGNTGGILREV
jgi:N-acetylglucosaminyldiphosphoundecaprenol N-acetyl-beta-D-mannosaminyltransferase